MPHIVMYRALSDKFPQEHKVFSLYEEGKQTGGSRCGEHRPHKMLLESNRFKSTQLQRQALEPEDPLTI